MTKGLDINTTVFAFRQCTDLETTAIQGAGERYFTQSWG